MKYEIKFSDVNGKGATLVVEAEDEYAAEALVKKDHPDSFVTSLEEVYGQVSYAVEAQRDGQPITRYYGYRDHKEAQGVAAVRQNSPTSRVYVVIERTQTGPGQYNEREL